MSIYRLVGFYNYSEGAGFRQAVYCRSDKYYLANSKPPTYNPNRETYNRSTIVDYYECEDIPCRNIIKYETSTKYQKGSSAECMFVYPDAKCVVGPIESIGCYILDNIDQILQHREIIRAVYERHLSPFMLDGRRVDSSEIQAITSNVYGVQFSLNQIDALHDIMIGYSNEGYWSGKETDGVKYAHSISMKKRVESSYRYVRSDEEGNLLVMLQGQKYSKSWFLSRYGAYGDIKSIEIECVGRLQAVQIKFRTPEAARIAASTIQAKMGNRMSRLNRLVEGRRRQMDLVRGVNVLTKSGKVLHDQ